MNKEDLNKEEPLLSDSLVALKERTQQVRIDILCMDEAGMAPMAEEYVMLALAVLDQATHFFKLAHYNQMQGK